MADYSKIKHLKDLNNSMFNERMNRAYDYGYEDGLARGTECGYKRGYDRGYDRLHKSIYGQTLEEMKEDKGTWEYEPDKPKNTLDDLWKNIKKWEIESHIDTLRNIIKVSDRSDCGIKEIDGTDEEAIMFAINVLEQIAEQEPYICDTCKHNDKEWDEEPCDGCCGNHSGYEPSGDLISRQAVLDALYELCNTGETLIENPWRDNPHIDALIDAIEDLPSVKQEPKTEQFAKWVAREIFDEMWEYNQGAFAELACRKLAKLGIVRANGGEWELVEPQENEE